MGAQESLREGQLERALAELTAEVRDDPSNVKLRVFLFQLLAVTAQWQRALTQLNVLREMDPSTIPMVHAYREALSCEVLREGVFGSGRSPLVFGDPEAWIARMIEAIRVDAGGGFEQAAQLRAEALEAAGPSSGTINGDAFEWIADADPRLGPILEAVVNGKYYWVPFSRIQKIVIEGPEDLRDLVWIPAQVTWANGGETVALIPSRYAGARADDDHDLLMARKTRWDSPKDGIFVGRGQRLLTTDRDEYPLLDVREIVLDNVADEPAKSGGVHRG